MAPELLQLIERWRERHPEAWPEGLEFHPELDVMQWVQLEETGSHFVTQRIALALIESAVMDWLCGRWYVVLVMDNAHGARASVGQITTTAPTRLHALLLAVEEMEAE